MRRAAKLDTTDKPLTAYAKSLGFSVLPINGTVDKLLWHPRMGQLVMIVEFKSAGGTLTERQQKLVAAGWPIRFLSNAEQIAALKAELIGRTS